MKVSILFILLLFLIPLSKSFAQKDNLATIKLTIRNCSAPNNIFRAKDTIWLINSAATDAAPIVFTNPDARGAFNKKEVPGAVYRVRFRNIFKQIIEKEISVNAGKTNEFQYCVDSLDSYPQNTLPLLQDEDSIVVNFVTTGCFHIAYEKIVIIRKNEQLVASVFAIPQKKNASGIINENTAYVLQDRTVLKQAQLLAFRKFENELRYIWQDGCTTEDNYNITSKYLNIRANDATCQWDGYYHLYNSLFGKR